MDMPSFTKTSYSQRAQTITNPLAKALLLLMEKKKTNLSVAADVSTKAELLALAETLGPFICVFKTHIDIISDFDQDLIEQLSQLAKKHEFYIFEGKFLVIFTLYLCYFFYDKDIYITMYR
jgi:orotidine-5'-phosphate decarboxylase